MNDDGTEANARELTDLAIAVCESMPGATEDYPFGPETTVFKVGGKLFALVSEMSGSLGMNLKIPPEDSEALCQIEGIGPGYHMNKKHWITVTFGPATDPELLSELIEDSYVLVRSTLTKKARLALDATE